MKQTTTTIKHYRQTHNLHYNPKPPQSTTHNLHHNPPNPQNPPPNPQNPQTPQITNPQRQIGKERLCQILLAVALASSSFLGSVKGRSAEYGFGGMGFWVRSEGKGSWIFGGLVEGREATWENKASELGGD